MIPTVRIIIELSDPATGLTKAVAHTTRSTGATDAADQEANTQRLAEWAVYEAFRRLRGESAEKKN